MVVVFVVFFVVIVVVAVVIVIIIVFVIVVVFVVIIVVVIVVFVVVIVVVIVVFVVVVIVGDGLSMTKPSGSHHLAPSAVPTPQVPESSPAAVASSFLCFRFSELLPLPLSEFVPLARFQDFTAEYSARGIG
jgi:hypothetical protein